MFNLSKERQIYLFLRHNVPLTYDNYTGYLQSSILIYDTYYIIQKNKKYWFHLYVFYIRNRNTSFFD
jgi:hypothetical protein